MTGPVRDVQLALIEGDERNIGPILPSVFHGTNADLMAAVAPLYLTGAVLDPTYGEGKWWVRFRPESLTAHDLHKLDGVDFRALPHPDRSFETVCYDPPYVLSGGTASPGAADLRERFGLDVGYNDRTLKALILDGLVECARVADRWLLVKCMEFAQGGRFHDIPNQVTNRAQDIGWRKHDQIVHATGTGPGGHNISEVKRARRAHSYLLVFTRHDPQPRPVRVVEPNESVA